MDESPLALNADEWDGEGPEKLYPYVPPAEAEPCNDYSRDYERNPSYGDVLYPDEVPAQNADRINIVKNDENKPWYLK